MSLRWLISAFALGVLTQSICLPIQAQQQETEEQLSSVQQEIKQQQTSLKQQRRQRSKLEKQLKQQEVKLGTLAKTHRQSQQEAKQLGQQTQNLKKEQSALSKQEAQQQALLAKQLKSAYMTGQHDLSKMLLNQSQAGDSERMLAYYKYLNKARLQELDELEKTMARLAEVEKELQTKQSRLNRVVEQQKTELAKLRQQQQARKKTLTEMETLVNTQADQLKRLKDSETNLKSELVRLQEEAARLEVKLNGLKSKRGKLIWPTAGKLANRFGTRKGGQLRWKGVYIQSQSGEAVKTVEQGKVLFADWMKGFGLVIVIDHGDDYMTLYAHNQALLKQVGDTVTRDEVIALVGQSGGQKQAGLYFEIRHKGRALNPSRWCKA